MYTNHNLLLNFYGTLPQQARLTAQMQKELTEDNADLDLKDFLGENHVQPIEEDKSKTMFECEIITCTTPAKLCIKHTGGNLDKSLLHELLMFVKSELESVTID